VRRFGAIVFGRLGDLVGRKYTFLVTILIMGLSTALIGVLPTYVTSYLLIGASLAIGTPFFGALTYLPIYIAMRHFANPSLLPKADPSQINHAMLIVLLTVQVLYVTMVYGPIAAFLVELFPTKIRYTSMSLPYHVASCR
jgi:MFS family permease